MQDATKRQLLRSIGTGATIGAAGLAGCSGNGDGGDGSDGGGSDGSGGATGTPGGVDPTSYHVGVFSPFSGPFGDWGPAHELGATLAAEDIQSDEDVEVEISTYDTETDPSAANERIQRAVTADGVDFVWGGIVGTVIQTIGSWTADNGIVYVTEQSTDCYPFMFQVYGSNRMLANAVAPEMAEMADSWYLMYSDYVWGQDAQEVIGDLLEEDGATVEGSDATPWPPEDRDFTPYLNNAANSDAEGLGFILPGAEAAQAMSQARNEGMLDDYEVMVHQNEDPTYWGAGKWAAETLDIAPTGWVNSAEGGDGFKQQVADRGNLDPFVRHATSYIGLDQLVRASIRAGSKEGEDVRDALEGHEITGSRINDIVSGDLYFRECDHQLVKPIYLVSGLAEADMQDSPYRQWFQVEETVPGDDAIDSCEEVGCDF